MSNREPVLQMYGPLHALSARGLHVRESARSWKLVVPLSADFLGGVRAFCERATRADAERLLVLLHFMGSTVELPPSVAPQTERMPQHPCC